MILPDIEMLFDQPDQARGHQVIIIHRVRIITNFGRIPHHYKHVSDAQGMRREQVSLHTQQVAPAGGEMQRGLYADFLLDQFTDRPWAHAHACHRAVSDVDHIRARFRQQAGSRQQFMGGQTARRTHLHRSGKLPRGEFLSQLRGRCRAGLIVHSLHRHAQFRNRWTTAIRQPIQRFAHGSDVLGCCPTTAADQARAGIA